MLRKLFFALTQRLAVGAASTQLACCFVIVLMSLLAHLWYRPFLNSHLDGLETTMLVTVLAVITVASFTVGKHDITCTALVIGIMVACAISVSVILVQMFSLRTKSEKSVERTKHLSSMISSRTKSKKNIERTQQLKGMIVRTQMKKVVV